MSKANGNGNHNGNGRGVQTVTAQPRLSDLERAFITYWHTIVPHQPEPAPEYRFCQDRKWRFDFAFPAHKVAIELEGGAYTQGRHTRGNGYEGDCEKYNRATSEGWRVLRFTRGMLAADPVTCIDQVVSLIDPLPVIYVTAAAIRAERT